MLPNFTGHWKANLSKCEFRSGPVPKEIFVDIDHAGEDLRAAMVVTTDSTKEERVAFECRTDGTAGRSTMNGRPIRGRSSWVNDELVIESWITSGERELYFRDCWSISADGRILRMEHRDDALAGQLAVLDRVEYDPFAPGMFDVNTLTIEAFDDVRNRRFPCEIWYPWLARFRKCPLVVYSHPSTGKRRSASFLCTHLSSHGYVVAAMDHSEVVDPDGFARKENETEEQTLARMNLWIMNRVPDARLLLDHLLTRWESDVQLDAGRVGIVGHSFGGWTALAATEVDWRIRAVVALAPGGASNPKPGILPLKLAFRWGRDVPALYLVAENDTALPLSGMQELYERTPATKQMFVLRNADHMHFMDNVEEQHERIRAMSLPGKAAAIAQEMRPIAELASGEQGHTFVRALTLSHMDAVLRQNPAARDILSGNVESILKQHGVEVTTHSC
ncbi:MAG TPA: CocE/NonD family hydrolase [Bryobacteraceae bacterium]|nr:CocE/NonD family hydrolase [Bryobacteraceae bacterium]